MPTSLQALRIDWSSKPLTSCTRDLTKASSPTRNEPLKDISKASSAEDPDKYLVK
ncbi:hypothetical protein [Paenibacillus sp. JGP012]|uniref:hypothetical protein n=1 Tax=Paenibacillus sp. JGP012 TaxID=2735914 RepID=UPI0021A97B5B|nr:hypothetical protein [Paenibacillus sp. JGP012]